MLITPHFIRKSSFAQEYAKKEIFYCFGEDEIYSYEERKD